MGATQEKLFMVLNWWCQYLFTLRLIDIILYFFTFNIEISDEKSNGILLVNSDCSIVMLKNMVSNQIQTAAIRHPEWLWGHYYSSAAKNWIWKPTLY